jgi:hypothetical protein
MATSEPNVDDLCDDFAKKNTITPVLETKVESKANIENTNKMETPQELHRNRGTGAGGAKTNENGNSFEDKTDNETRLLKDGFVKRKIPKKNGKYAYYLEKTLEPTKTVVYVTQGGLKAYFEVTFGKKMCRNPDEAYIFRNGDKYTVKILEKKNQNTPGSVDTKLMTGPGFIWEYKRMLGDGFELKYAFCISNFLKKDYASEDEKYKSLREFNEHHGIQVLFGDDPDYYETLDAWINS